MQNGKDMKGVLLWNNALRWRRKDGVAVSPDYAKHTRMSLNQITQIILLTSPDETPPLGDLLRLQNPALEIVGAHDRAVVEQACANASSGTRLVSFCSPVVVPAAALAALPGPAYNFHPGPPTRPGRYPSVFALYDGDKQFGITVHEMAPKVDSGAIVAVEWFDVAPGLRPRRPRETDAICALSAVFRKRLAHLATRAAPVLAHAWSGRKDHGPRRLSQITPDMPPRPKSPGGGAPAGKSKCRAMIQAGGVIAAQGPRGTRPSTSTSTAPRPGGKQRPRAGIGGRAGGEDVVDQQHALAGDRTYRAMDGERALPHCGGARCGRDGPASGRRLDARQGIGHHRLAV